jgi:SAM-dependent methyltransferase
MSNYSPRFFELHAAGAARSAQVIVPLIREVVTVGSVVDVGCATGAWLDAFVAHGIGDYAGIDFHAAPEQHLPPERFRVLDLRAPFTLERRFDLALCLEVAEHLPPSSASGLIASLARLAPVIAFSAAIPFQGGTHHINEQWPDYWANLFREHHYLPVDCIRPLIWNHAEVEWWYAQNLLLFVAEPQLAVPGPLRELYDKGRGRPLSMVHPRAYLFSADPSQIPLRRLLTHLGGSTKRLVRNALLRARHAAGTT